MDRLNVAVVVVKDFRFTVYLTEQWSREVLKAFDAIFGLSLDLLVVLVVLSEFAS